MKGIVGIVDGGMMAAVCTHDSAASVPLFPSFSSRMGAQDRIRVQSVALDERCATVLSSSETAWNLT